MSDEVTKTLAYWNEEAGVTDSDDYELGWINSKTGRFVDEEYYSSDYWYGIEGFGTFDDPGPDWVRVERRVQRHTETGEWKIVEEETA